MGIHHSSNSLSAIEQFHLDSQMREAIEDGDYKKVYTSGGLDASLSQKVHDIPILHYLMLKGISDIENIYHFDSLIAYFTCYSGLHGKRQRFDLSMRIDSYDMFHFSEGFERFGDSGLDQDSIEINHTPAEFALELKRRFESKFYSDQAWEFANSDIHDYVITTLDDWYKYFKIVESTPNVQLCDRSTHVYSDNYGLHKIPDALNEDQLIDCRMSSLQFLPEPSAPPAPPDCLHIACPEI